jgi:hypothetical protein
MLHMNENGVGKNDSAAPVHPQAGGGDQVFYITPGSLRTVFKGFQK